MAFDSVVSPISTSVKLSSSIPSSGAGKLLEFSLAQKVRTGSVGNVLVYWLTDKPIGESSDVIIVSTPSVTWWPNLKALPNFSTMYLCNLSMAA